ncbi:MAG: hypothetical protein COB49_04855, partial [Alphaproteobacteria bacterium]
GVTTLEAVAENVTGEGRIAIAHDARRSEVYLQIFDLKAGHVIPVSRPLAVPLCEVEDCLDGKVTAVFGTGVELVKTALSQDVMNKLAFPDIPPEPDAATVGRMIHAHLAAGGHVDEVVPLYLRPPDAVAAKPVTYSFHNQ